MSKELAWAAAFLEAEGSVFIREVGNSKTLTPIVVVNNTELPLIKRWHEAVGGLGSLHGPRVKKGSLGNLPSYRINASFRMAEAILEMLLPYMTPETKRYTRAVKGLALMGDRRRQGYNNLPSIGPELGRVESFADISELWHKTVQSMLFGTLENRAIDYIASIDVIKYGNILTAESMAFDFDLGRN